MTAKRYIVSSREAPLVEGVVPRGDVRIASARPGPRWRRFGMSLVTLEQASAEALRARGARVRSERSFELPKGWGPRKVERDQLGLEKAMTERSWALDAVGIRDNGFTGKGVKVALLDSGIWMGHPDFAGRPIVTKSFVPGITTANEDEIGHGTFCAGLIAGPLVPSEGARYGVAPDVELFVGRVFDEEARAAEEHVIDGIHWALDHGCRIICLALGDLAQDAPDPDYETIATEAANAGCLLIAAAGNDSVRPTKRPVRVPADSNRVLAVAAANKRIIATNDSCAGLRGDGGEVNLAGPGPDVYSACAPSTIPYATASGTSAAVAIVAGVAAQILEQTSALSAGELWKVLVEGVRPPEHPRTNGSLAEDVGAGMARVP